MAFIHLAHVLDPSDYAWPDEPVLEVRPDTVIHETGKPFNSIISTLPNHFGTHMDGPHHFNTVGTAFDELPIETFGYEGDEVLVVDLPHRCAPAEVIVKEDVEFYQMKGLSLHPDLCRWLNEECPDLACVAMDWLSVASPTNDYGEEAHHWLLGNYTDHVITAIEDMPMAALGDRKIKAVTLGPLRIKGADSSQVCAMAWVED